MKKIVRIVWIGLLSGMAFLVACTSQNRLTRAQRNELQKEREAVTQQIDSLRSMAARTNDAKETFRLRNEELKLRDRLGIIANQLKDTDAFVLNMEKIDAIQQEMDSLQRVIDHGNIPPCVYGPPR